MNSGIPNYCSVAIALIELGYKPLGVRLDSGDLASLSIAINELFMKLNDTYSEFGSMVIVASNDLDEHSIIKLEENYSKCGALGIGTNLATAKEQPSLGCVYKLVDRGGVARLKKSEEPGKTTIPGKKYIFRLFDEANHAIADLMLLHPNIENVCEGNTIRVFNPKDRSMSRVVTFSRYELVLKPVIVNGVLQISHENATREARVRCMRELATLGENFTRIEKPDKYMVGVDSEFSSLITSMLE
jgi:nicotinate phosphoribosyltransferase